MRILVVNKFWYQRGGLERVVFDEVRWLEQAGHEVAHFACAHPRNEASVWSGYFAPYIELGPEAELGVGAKALAAVRMLHNGPAARRFLRLLADFAPDVVHCHGIHRQLSPSIVAAARGRGVPVVMTMHDYNIVCPQDLLVRGDGVLCRPQLCGRHNYLPCIRHRCVRGTRSMSTVAAAELFWRRWLRRLARLVDEVVAPSSFLAGVITDGGWPKERVTVVPNGIELDPESPPGDYFMFAGRIAAEKGAATIFTAAQEAGVRLVMAGEGPMRAELEARDVGAVEFLGPVDQQTVRERMAGALAIVVPSEWYENCSLTALEALAAGRALIAPSVGGFLEIARDGREGLLVPVGDLEGYVEALRRLDADRELATRMGRAARARAMDRFAPETHLGGLLEVYERARGVAR